MAGHAGDVIINVTYKLCCLPMTTTSWAILYWNFQSRNISYVSYPFGFWRNPMEPAVIYSYTV